MNFIQVGLFVEFDLELTTEVGILLDGLGGEVP